MLLFVESKLVEGITIATVCLLVAAVVLVGVLNRKTRVSSTKAIAYGAVCVALSFTLSFIKFEMPYGGSITLASMTPLIIYSMCFGGVNGLICGVVYGLLQFIQAPWFINPVQFSLDYILAFGMVAVCGFIARKSITAKTIALSGGVFYLLRLVCHVAAGIIFYSTPDMRAAVLPLFGDTAEMSAFVYSSLYNLIYMVPECIIGLGLLIGCKFGSKSFNKLLGKLTENPQ